MLVEVIVFVCLKCIENMRFCIEVIDLYVDIEYRDFCFLGLYFICSIIIVFVFVLCFLVSCAERLLSCCDVLRRWNDVSSDVYECW